MYQGCKEIIYNANENNKLYYSPEFIPLLKNEELKNKHAL